MNKPVPPPPAPPKQEKPAEQPKTNPAGEKMEVEENTPAGSTPKT